MPIEVTTVPSAGTAGVAVSPAGSAMFDLRAIRQKKLDALHLDLQVPRWDDQGGPEMWVRYRPTQTAEVIKSMDRRQEGAAKGKDGKLDPDWVMLTSADVLVNCCVTVYAKDAAGQRFTLQDGAWVAFDPSVGPPTVFGPELAAALGLESSKAVDVCRALFFTDGDLTGHSQAVGAWSGVAVPKADEETLGK